MTDKTDSKPKRERRWLDYRTHNLAHTKPLQADFEAYVAEYADKDVPRMSYEASLEDVGYLRDMVEAMITMSNSEREDAVKRDNHTDTVRSAGKGVFYKYLLFQIDSIKYSKENGSEFAYFLQFVIEDAIELYAETLEDNPNDGHFEGRLSAALLTLQANYPATYADYTSG